MGRIIKVIYFFTLIIYYKSLVKSDKYGEVIYSAVKELGGVYVKLIQFVCLRTEVFPNDQKMKFLSFYDAVPAEPMNIHDILIKELGPTKICQFKYLQNQPFASGTFGQVYMGELIDGTKAVVKLKRPHLLPKLKIDFFILKLGARVFNLFYYQNILDAVKLVKEFEELTCKELDYKAELRNAQYFYDTYKTHQHICIPKTYDQLSSSNVLTQEYVGGISLTTIIRYKDRQHKDDYNSWLRHNYHTDMQFVLKNLAFELALQGIYHPYFYADPHPGNIKILPDNRYALIDFGIVGTSPKNKRNYHKIISLIVEKADKLNMKSLGKEFLEWGATHFYECIEVLDDHLGVKETQLLHFITSEYEHLLEAKREKFREIEIKEQENFVQMYIDILQAGQKLKVRLPEGVVAMLRTVAIYKSWNEFLEPDMHHMRETYRNVLNVVDENALLNTDDINRTKATLEEAIEKVLDWVENVAEFDLSFYNKLSQKLQHIHYV